MDKKDKARGRKASVQEKVQDWLEIASEDLEVAELCLNGCKYLHAAYMCQQAVEKALKACITAGNEIPMPIHNLVQLATSAGIWDEVTTDQKIFLRALTTYAIEARYPERKERLLEECTREEADKIFNATKELIPWLKGKIEEKLSQI